MNQLVTELSVAAVKTPSYGQNEVQAAVRRIFELLDVPARLIRVQSRLQTERPGTAIHVLLKPNLLMKRRPEEGTTTHPAVVEAVARCLRECGVSNITIADSPGGPYAKGYLAPIYAASGMKDAAEHTEAKLNHDFDSYEKRNENGVMCKHFTLISPVKQADFVINLPKLKTHGMMTLSGGVKNLFGCIPGLMKPELHWRFPENDRFAGMLLDLAETVKPELTICDAVVSMEGDGPSGGVLRETGYLFASRSPYSLDLALCKAIQLDGDRAPTVRLAKERGLCVDSPEKLSLCGDAFPLFSGFRLPKSCSVNFTMRLPRPIRGAADKLLRDRPAVRKDQCVGCGKCVESCPAKTIQIVGGKARIDSKGCIRCYCCQELCSVKAIAIKRFKLFDL